jgi:hypothetical protein
MPISRRRYSSGPLGLEVAPTAANRGGYRRDSRNQVRCGVCTRELAEEGLHLETAEHLPTPSTSPLIRQQRSRVPDDGMAPARDPSLHGRLPRRRRLRAQVERSG